MYFMEKEEKNPFQAIIALKEFMIWVRKSQA
jgi:hypothetical protein